MVPLGGGILSNETERDGPATLAEAVLDLRSSRADYQAVFARNPVAMALLDGTGRVLHANAAAGRLLGTTEGALVGQVLHELATSEDVGRLKPGTAERRMRHSRGHDVWVLASAVELPEAGQNALLVCLEDATTRRNTERLLLHAALHDSLTNLPNRRLLRDRLDTALARAARSDSTVAVLFIDLDRFKEVNDALGHDAGDEVLVAVAGTIHDALRSSDTVARLGGDEFVVVCEDVDDIADVTHLAERLIEGIRAPLHIHGQRVSVSASIGIAVAGAEIESGDELIRTADVAMFRAKHRPDTAYVLADDTTRDLGGGSGLAAGSLMADLRHAVQADQLQLHYQPVVRVDGRLVGLEALVRWPHPRLGTLLPQDFLPRVAGTDLARPLTDWVLRAAIRDAATWDDPRVRVSVNMWAAEVARPGFADTVALLLTWAGVQAGGLYLELHEEDLPEGGPGLGDELDRLRRLGVGLAIDDVGVGGTSLAGLRRLPVDTLKVDRSFVAGILHDPEDSAVAAAVATLAHTAGRHALATGVETVEQLRALSAMGYESVQGYLAGAPAPLRELRHVIAARRVVLPA